ncbi:NPCBM/NEW2 domain-containing protein [Streptomyces sp. NPDC055025]
MPDLSQPGRRLGDIAALISAFAAVLGVLLGFFGLPTVVNSPTAQTVTATATATVTVTAPATTPSGSDAEASANPSSPAPLPTGTVPLADLSPVRGSFSLNLQSVAMGSKPYEQAMTFNPCYADALEYSINERYKSLTMTIGLDDNSTAKMFNVRIKGDDHVLKTVGAEINRPQNVTVDMTGVVKLEIDFTTNDDCPLRNNILLALADATLYS